ncbi:MAG: hypothetical protein IJX67_09800 [Oscillospiraceae bacterium]|nr:hypothetical protein [Oscillospiraceae bacterium]MBQ9168684.1 hypothetical protein [Oscillospiraceae bacterium]
MESNYTLAGIEITAYIPDDMNYRNGRLLGNFLVETVRDPHAFHFNISNELPELKFPVVTRQDSYTVYGNEECQIRCIGEKSSPHMTVIHKGKEHFVYLKASDYPNGITEKTVLNALSLEHLVTQISGFVFHCSYIEHNGKAILFTAPSGTGKSTQATLWNKYRDTQIINGDRAVIRIENEQVLACGIPFAGSSVYCENRTLPVAAIVYLAQAPQTTIRKMRGYEAFSKLWEGVSVNTWDKEDMANVSYAVEQTASKVPVYYLACTPDESAVKALEGVL